MRDLWPRKLIMAKDNVLQYPFLNLYHDYFGLEFLKHTCSLRMYMSVWEVETANSNCYISTIRLLGSFCCEVMLPTLIEVTSIYASIHQLWYKNRMLMCGIKTGHFEYGGIIIWPQLSTQCMWATPLIIKQAAVHAKISFWMQL